MTEGDRGGLSAVRAMSTLRGAGEYLHQYVLVQYAVQQLKRGREKVSYAFSPIVVSGLWYWFCCSLAPIQYLVTVFVLISR